MWQGVPNLVDCNGCKSYDAMFSISKMLRTPVSYSPMSTSVVTCDRFHITAKVHNGIWERISFRRKTHFQLTHNLNIISNVHNILNTSSLLKAVKLWGWGEAILEILLYRIFNYFKSNISLTSGKNRNNKERTLLLCKCKGVW